MTWGDGRRALMAIVRSHIGHFPLSAGDLKCRVRNDYGEFCEREFWRVLKELCNSGEVEKEGRARDAWNGGYRLARKR